jgi:hypothetical protein
VQELGDEFERFDIQHVSRDKNWEADELLEGGFNN